MFELDLESISCGNGAYNMNEKLVSQLIKYSEFYNMKEVCQLAGVNYQVFRNWKSNPTNNAISEDKAKELLKTMKNLYKIIGEQEKKENGK